MNSYYEKMVATGEVKCIDEEIPFEVPNGWEWCRLGSLFLHTSGKQQSSNNKSGGTPKKFITTSNLYWGYFNLDNVKVMNFTEDEIMSCSATKGDLLVCEGGAGYGRSAIWDKEYDICLQNHIHRLRPLVKGLCEYVYHFIYFLKETNQLASVGTAMPGLSANRLKNLLVPLPPISEQEKIVVKLKTLMPHVEKYAASKNILDELNKSVYTLIRKSILQEAVQGKLVPQYADEGTASELLDAIREEKLKLVREGKLKKKDIVDSIIFKGDDNKYYENEGKKVTDITNKIPFDIPISWQWCRLKTVSKIIGGYAFDGKEIKSEVGIQVIKISDFDEYGWVKKNITYYKGNLDLDQYRLSTNDILIAMTGGTVGKSYHIGQLSKAMLLNQRVASIRVYDFSSYYLNIVIKSPFIQDVINNCKNSTNDNISMVDISNFLIPLPPLNEQKRIVAMIENLFIKLK